MNPAQAYANEDARLIQEPQRRANCTHPCAARYPLQDSSQLREIAPSEVLPRQLHSALAPQQTLDSVEDKRYSNTYEHKPSDPGGVGLHPAVPPRPAGVELPAGQAGQNYQVATDSNLKPFHV
jgi:hypothetical protein